MSLQKVVEQSMFGHIETGMWAMFILGLISLFAYSWKTEKESKGVKKYMTMSTPNIVFHLVASLMLFLTLEETGEYLIQYFFPSFNASEAYHYTLSGLTGMFGSVLVAWILELGKKLIGRK